MRREYFPHHYPVTSKETATLNCQILYKWWDIHKCRVAHYQKIHYTQAWTQVEGGPLFEIITWLRGFLERNCSGCPWRRDV